MNVPDTPGGAVNMTSFASVSSISNKNVLMLLAAMLFAVLMAMPLQAAVAPDSGSAGTQTVAFLNITGPIVVQPCANITLGGSLINASNVSQPLASYNLTVRYNSTHNNSINVTGSFQFNLTAPCTTQGRSGNFSLDNLTVYTNSSDNHSKGLRFFVSNATNVSVIILGQKPPFARGTNNTVNITYFNGSNALSGNIPFLRVYNSLGQLETAGVQLYNLSASTNAQGIIQYNISVASSAAGGYSLVVDYGLANFFFQTQAAYALTFMTQTISGESRVSFAPRSTVNLIAKSRYSNGSAYDLAAGDYITAFVTLPNRTIYEMNLTAIDSATNPGANNKTFSLTELPGGYKIRIIGILAGSSFETFGQFEIRGGLARLQAGSDFFQRMGDKGVILPGQSVRFNVLMYNNSDDGLMDGVNCNNSNGFAGFDGFTNLANGQNATYAGSAIGSFVNFGGQTICAITVNVPNAVGTYRVNATYVDPANDSLRIGAEGIVEVRNYGLFMYPCPGALTDYAACGFAPIFQRNSNVTFEFRIDNFTGGATLARSNILNVTGITMRKFSFGVGSSSEVTNWVENVSYFITYPRTDTNALRIVLDLPDDATGPRELQLVVNTSVGVLRSSGFFMVKSSSIEAHGGPSNGQGGFNPQISCNGTFPFFLEAFDLNTQQAAQGVIIQGVRGVRHVISGKVLDSTFITGVTTNSTDSSGQATYNVTFNTSKTFLPGPYDMLVNVSFQGVEDEGFSGFMCGSGSYDKMFKPEGFDGQGPQGGGPAGGQNFQGGIRGGISGMPPQVGPNTTVAIVFNGLGFGGQGSQQGSGMNDFGGNQMNGTLRITAIRFFNQFAGSERTITATQTLLFNVSNSMSNINVSPAYFNLDGWPLGFMMLQVNLTNGTTPGVGTTPSVTGQLPGFQVAPFRIFVNTSGVPNPLTVGMNLSIIVNVTNNVSTSGNNFTLRAQSMSSNNQVGVAFLSGQLMIDSWNRSEDSGAEQWNVTFTVPRMDPGQVRFIVTVNNSQSVTAEVDLPARIAGLEVRPLQGLIMSMTGNNCQVFDDSGENGTMQNCFPEGFGTQYLPSEANIGSRLNFSLFNVTYNVSSKSGQVCYKSALNWSTFTPQGQVVLSLSNTTYVAVIDNNTPGTYDTLVFNNTDGNVTVMPLTNVSAASRRFNRFNASFSDIYAVMTEGCGVIKLANGSENPADMFSMIPMGRNPANVKFYFVYRVFNGGVPVSNAYVDMLGVGNMTLDGSNLVNMLPTSMYRTRGSTSNAQGVAFVEVNVTSAGERQLFWSVNGTVNGQFVNVFAKVQQDKNAYGGGGGSRVTILNFNTFCSGFDNNLRRNDQNLSTTCSASYFNNTAVAGVNFSLSARTWGPSGSSVVPLTLNNETTGERLDGFLSDASGRVTFNFTKSGGWVQGVAYEIFGTADGAGSVEQLMLGRVGLGGGSGGVGGSGGPS